MTRLAKSLKVMGIVGICLASGAAPSISAATTLQPNIEKIWRFYSDATLQYQVGETLFFCNGSTQTTGFVSSDYVEDYYGWCP